MKQPYLIRRDECVKMSVRVGPSAGTLERFASGAQSMARQRLKRIEGTILVADDHEVLRIGVVQLLRESFGVGATLHAETFDEALERAGDPSVRLIILDLGMPGLGCPQELVKIRRARPEAKVVVLSGSEEPDDILAALSAGVHGYIIKNARLDSLVERLSYILAGEIYVPAILAERATSETVDLKAQATPLRSSTGAMQLSDRQRQVLKGLVLGQSNKQIARDLKLAEGTVKMHIGALFRALGAVNRAHAAALGKPLIE